MKAHAILIRQFDTFKLMNKKYFLQKKAQKKESQSNIK